MKEPEIKMHKESFFAVSNEMIQLVCYMGILAIVATMFAFILFLGRLALNPPLVVDTEYVSSLSDEEIERISKFFEVDDIAELEFWKPNSRDPI